MKTEVNTIIPIYNFKLKIIFIDNIEEFPTNMGQEHKYRQGSIEYFRNNITFVNYSDCFDNIVHEAEHIKNVIWDHIGYKPSATNDEVDAYLIEYIYKKLTDVYHKHMKKIKK